MAEMGHPTLELLGGHPEKTVTLRATLGVPPKHGQRGDFLSPALEDKLSHSGATVDNVLSNLFHEPSDQGKEPTAKLDLRAQRVSQHPHLTDKAGAQRG